MTNPLGNDYEKLTHIHMVVYTWWCWHIYKGAFGKMECLFSIAPDANSCGWHIGARVKKLEVKNELIAKTLASVN